MARIILGIGTSHSPTLNNRVENWLPPGPEARDKPGLKAAGLGDWDEMVRERASWLPPLLAEERVRERYERCQRAIDALSEILHRVSPDVLVIAGDDHYEVYSPDHMPAMSVFWADSMVVLPLMGARNQGPRPKPAEHVYPGDSDLAGHVLQCLVAEGFDLAHSRSLCDRETLGHTFDFVCRRLMGDKRIPQVPILLNTYYPPNRPTVKRCWDMGRTLRRAIESWNSDKTIGIVGSGGLTHMVLDEEMDRAILAAIRDRNQEGATCFPERLFVDGTSEIKAWMVLAGAMEEDEREMQLIDYQPCYRTPAGTGCGMAFAYWADA